MTKPLLIEVGVEELPAIPFLNELPAIEPKWLDLLEREGLGCEFEFYYTPRRLVLWHPAFPLSQPTRYEEFFGAPLSAAYKDAEPTPAAIGFAKKCGVEVNELGSIVRGDKEVLYVKKEIQGVSSKEILGRMVEAWLKSLNFGKSMRWGSLEESFIRPVRSLAMMLGDEHVTGEVFGVASMYFTYPHRSVSYEPLAFDQAGDYFDKLVQGGVVVFQEERRASIVEQIQEIEAIWGIEVEKDAALLAEVVAITEHPKALLGSFDEKFLTLPPEVIITSMKENQRYFPVFKEGKLTNRFVVVSNAIASAYELIVSGNEKVLRARLEDALFFWENDLRNGLSSEGLKKIVYLEGLGSVYDKVEREQKVGAYLAQHYKARLLKERPDLDEHALMALLERTIGLCKADLLSEMVYEFTELQGTMGYYYATKGGHDASLALAFKEQYLPNSEESPLPSTLFSAIVALSYKIDSLLALFSIGKIPTGTKDPFALRRAVGGIVKIALDQQLPFNISTDFSALASQYKTFDVNLLEAFVIERLYPFFDANPSIIKAVLESGERDIVTLERKVTALKTIVASSGFKESLSTFKRVANSVKDVDVRGVLEVSPALFEAQEEKALFEAFSAVTAKEYADYETQLDALFSLKPQIDAFFEKVMVNVEDPTLRRNRQHLIASVYRAFLSIADIKEISI
ncbi:MAG: glycine--tRNA ligase subunit beta [Campylobacterales bacterium]|nr:glycine--tRNA ligase subunit beta [Campylobacterales bacterium]